MLNAGPNTMDMPLARLSLPITHPVSSTSAGFHVAANPNPDGNTVTAPARMPRGPSAAYMGRIPSRGTPGSTTSPNLSPPKHNRTFSSGVIRSIAF